MHSKRSYRSVSITRLLGASVPASAHAGVAMLTLHSQSIHPMPYHKHNGLTLQRPVDTDGRTCELVGSRGEGALPLCKV